MFKRLLKRTFGNDGGSIATVRDELGRFDLIAALAVLVRGVTALVIATVAILLANLAGVPVEVITELAEKIKQLLP